MEHKRSSDPEVDWAEQDRITRDAVLIANARRMYADEIEAHSRAYRRDWRNWVTPLWIGLMLSLGVFLTSLAAGGLGIIMAVLIGLVIADALMQ